MSDRPDRHTAIVLRDSSFADNFRDRGRVFWDSHFLGNLSLS